MDPSRQSVPEVGAYQVIRWIVTDLRRAERTLAQIQEKAPDSERALHLVAIRAALAQLETFIRGLPER